MNLEKLAKALKINTDLTEEDIMRIREMRETGLYGVDSARNELYAEKILARISDLVEKIEGNK